MDMKKFNKKCLDFHERRTYNNEMLYSFEIGTLNILREIHLFRNKLEQIGVSLRTKPYMDTDILIQFDMHLRKIYETIGKLDSIKVEILALKLDIPKIN